MSVSYVLYTNNTKPKIVEKKISKFYDLWASDNDELIIVDDFSEGNTVPTIVNCVGVNFVDKEHFKFFINTPKKGKKESLKMAYGLATNEQIRIL